MIRNFVIRNYVIRTFVIWNFVIRNFVPVLLVFSTTADIPALTSKPTDVDSAFANVNAALRIP